LGNHHDTHHEDMGTWTDRTLSASAPPDRRTHDLLRQLFDLNTVFDITCRLHAVMDTNALLDGILMTAIGQLGVGAAAIVIQKPNEPERLTLARWKGWTDVAAEEWIVDLNSPFAEALSEVCGPITYAELREHLNPHADEARVLTRRGCELVAPLQCRDRLRGVLYTTAKMNGQPFSDADFQFLRLIIEQFSVAIENAVLYESERRYAEDLIQARERLLQHEKMATLGRLSAAIAHEINNPLGIIRNYIQLIREELADHPQSLKSLNLVSEEVDRIARTVRQLLDAFRPGTGRPRAVDVGNVLNEVLEFLDPELHKHGITVERTNLDDLPFTIARQDPLRQVFLNLTLNAQDAMPDGGALRVSAEVDDESVVVSFTDEGTGIDDESLDRIFDPFYSTKGPRHGTGLGLAICRSILEGLGGSITAANVSRPQKGAIFRVTLPRVESISNGSRPLSAGNNDNRTTSKTGH
jgi:signal transduction histidine kinase